MVERDNRRLQTPAAKRPALRDDVIAVCASTHGYGIVPLTTPETA